MWNFFSKKAEKEELDDLKKAVQTGFNTVKQDVNNTSVWIDHLNTNNTKLKSEILEIKDDLSTIKEEIENIKNVISILGEMPAFKQRKTVFDKQTGVDGVLNSVQTTVQTAFLDNLSTTERAIIFVLLNSEMKLSYDDLASMLGKTKSTIRGQINNIKQKSEGLIEETINENNKKRVYIPEKVKEILLKKGKVKVKNKRREEYS
jgi:predicted transcriptional regulator